MNLKRKIQHLSVLFLTFTLMIAVFPAGSTAEEATDYTEVIETTIQEAVSHVTDKGVTTEWEAIGVYQAGFEVPESYRDIFNRNLEQQVIQGDRVKITDIERLAMAAHTLDIDPRDINGVNLIERIYNSTDNSNGADSMTFQGNNGPIFALIALDSGSYDVPDDARWTREALIQYLLDGQNDDGSWSLYGTAPSYDITAMALIALGKYKNQADVQQAIQAAVAFLSDAQGEEGGFNDPWHGGISLESAAQVLLGLTSVGIDPVSEAFTKEKANLVEHLLSFKAEDGGFKHLPGDSTSNGMATEQGLQALVAYQLFVQGKDGIYDFTQMEDIVDEPEQETETPIGEETDVAAGETVKVAGSKAEVVLPEDLPEGTALTITIPDEASAPNADADLKRAGEWFDFNFIGLEGFTGSFSLTLGVDNNADLEKIGMYHFNEEEEKWELIEAEIDQENRTITANVDHFSMYGVFERNETPVDEGSEETEDPAEDETPVDEEDPAEDDKPVVEDDPAEDETPVDKEDLGNDEAETDDSSIDSEVDSPENNDKKTANEDGLPEEKDASSKQDETGHLLPTTATHTYNFLLAGILLLVIGSSLLIFRKIRVKIN